MDERIRLRVAELLTQPKVLKKLYAYAYYYDRETGHRLPVDLEPADMVHAAIEDILTGQRTWDQDRYPNVEVVIKGMIKSEFYNAFGKKRVRIEHKTTTIQSKEESGPSGDNCVYDDILKEIEQGLEDDDEALEVYFAFLDGCRKPQEVADKLGLDIEEVRNRWKRLKRKARKITKKGT